MVSYYPFPENDTKAEIHLRSQSIMVDYKVRIKIIDIQGTGTCPAGHKIGDEFLHPGGTAALCPMALHILFPALRVYQFGGNHPWEKEEGKAKLCCNDPDNPVVFELSVEKYH